MNSLYRIVIIIGLSAVISTVFDTVETGGSLKSLTTYGRNSNPLLSPDGRKIAFFSTGPLKGEQKEGLWVMNADGSGMKWVSYFTPFQWSKDGKMIYGINFYENLVKSVEVNSRKQVTCCKLPRPYSVRSLSWSPDGKKIAFVRSEAVSEGSISVINIMAGKLERLTIPIRDYKFHVTSPQWSPQGDRIAFTVNQITVHPYTKKSVYSGKTAIGLIHLETRQLKMLTALEFLASEPRWSPDGKKIAFYAPSGRTPSLWVMNSDGSGKRLLVKGRKFQPPGSGYLYWSPDSRKIAYVVGASLGGPPGSEGPPASIYIVNVETTKVAELMHDEQGRIYKTLQWSPDGKNIYFVWKDDIWTMSLKN